MSYGDQGMWKRTLMRCVHYIREAYWPFFRVPGKTLLKEGFCWLEEPDSSFHAVWLGLTARVSGNKAQKHAFLISSHPAWIRFSFGIGAFGHIRIVRWVLSLLRIDCLSAPGYNERGCSYLGAGGGSCDHQGLQGKESPGNMELWSRDSFLREGLLSTIAWRAMFSFFIKEGGISLLLIQAPRPPT